jgi:cytidylate kinase
MVGRDIGTVVLPDARLKIYLTASDATRARRRYEELLAQGAQAEYEAVLKALRHRDRIDSQREASPLRPAKDARIVDTDRLGLQEVVSTIERMATGG